MRPGGGSERLGLIYPAKVLGACGKVCEVVLRSVKKRKRVSFPLEAEGRGETVFLLLRDCDLLLGPLAIFYTYEQLSRRKVYRISRSTGIICTAW